MKQFTDNQGREWTLAVTHGAIVRVRGLIGVDLYKFAEGEPPLMVRLHEPAVFCDVLYGLCQPECRGRGVSSEQFGESLGGEAIHAARSAFFEEYQDFFLGLRASEAAAALARVREFFDVVIQRGAEAVASLLTSSGSSSSSPASSA